MPSWTKVHQILKARKLKIMVPQSAPIKNVAPHFAHPCTLTKTTTSGIIEFLSTKGTFKSLKAKMLARTQPTITLQLIDVESGANPLKLRKVL